MKYKGIQFKLEEYMNRYVDTWPFSGSVSVTRHGEVIFEKGYGMASIEHRVSNIPNTKFRIWSITKQFTAVAILMLEERGLLKISDTLRSYFPNYPEFDERITIHHLLTNTSGIFNYSNIPESHKNLYRIPLTSEELIGFFKDRPLKFEPGSNWDYSNSGYYLLGLIIEKVSGKTYDKFLKDNIFDTLGMKNSGVDDNRTILQNKATGYYLNDESLIQCEYVDMNTVFSSGGMYSTVEDMNLWIEGLFGGRLIKKASIEKMITPYKNQYGYGVFIDEQFNRRRINHGGGCEGFLTELHYYVEEGVSISVFSNYGFTAVWGISETLAAIVFGESYKFPYKPEPYKLPSERYEEYMGIYEDNGTKLTVTKDKDKIFFTIDDDYIIPMYPVSETKFHHTWIDEEYEFKRDEEGQLYFWGIKKV